MSCEKKAQGQEKNRFQHARLRDQSGLQLRIKLKRKGQNVDEKIQRAEKSDRQSRARDTKKDFQLGTSIWQST